MPIPSASWVQTRNHDAGNQPRTTPLLTAVAPTPMASAMFFRPMASANCWLVIMMATLFPQMVERCKPTFGGLRKSFAREMSQGMADYIYKEIGARLEAVRQGFSDLSQSAWAQRHGFSVTQYNNWTSGARRIPIDEAEKLCGLYGLTLDFVYLGRRDGLSESASKVI